MIAKLTEVLADMNRLSAAERVATDLAELADAIEALIKS
jgi:hypothetical protein